MVFFSHFILYYTFGFTQINFLFLGIYIFITTTVSGECPRCAFDLWKGDLIANDPGFEDLPRVACPTCATTYSLRTGRYGPPLKRTGLAGFVGRLAKTATAGDKPKDAEAFEITLDDEGRVFCRKRPPVTRAL
jgi:hypothetical protein